MPRMGLGLNRTNKPQKPKPTKAERDKEAKELLSEAIKDLNESKTKR